MMNALLDSVSVVAGYTSQLDLDINEIYSLFCIMPLHRFLIETPLTSPSSTSAVAPQSPMTTCLHRSEIFLKTVLTVQIKTHFR